MTVKHIIIEGLPATGKSEVSNFLKIYFPDSYRYLPEMTTEIVNKHKINIIKDRKKLTDVLEQEIVLRQNEIADLKNELEQKSDYGIILEESHIGVHWAYSKFFNDKYFLDKYEQMKEKLVFPDFFIRLIIPFDLSYKRQIARNTPDLEVNTDAIKTMYENLKEWHKNNHNKKVYELNADRSPDTVLKDIMNLLGLSYKNYG
jgi:thymidylate kinase